MGFTLVARDGEREYGDGASYRIEAAGVLVVDDGKGKRLTYSPGGWDLIEDASRPPPLTSGV